MTGRGITVVYSLDVAADAAAFAGSVGATFGLTSDGRAVVVDIPAGPVADQLRPFLVEQEG